MNYLDLRDLAEEWRGAWEVLTEPGEYSNDELEDANETAERIRQLAEQLDIDNPDDMANRDEPTLIPEDEFMNYARELAEDCGMIPNDVSWPMTCIDWEQAANELKMDYTCYTYNGHDYYGRSY